MEIHFAAHVTSRLRRPALRHDPPGRAEFISAGSARTRRYGSGRYGLEAVHLLINQLVGFFSGQKIKKIKNTHLDSMLRFKREIFRAIY